MRAMIAAGLILAGCSGSVDGPPLVDDPNRITIIPATATLYAGFPTTFQITGGTGSYILASSNQFILPVSGTSRGTLQVIPAQVVADTDITLTVRDTGTAPVVTATVTVRPSTVSNEIIIRPTSTQDCGTAVCSGGDAEVVATISQGGTPLPARGVRFEVVSGDFRFLSGGELAASVTVVSDQAGKVQTVLRALPGAPNQTAILQITELGTGAFQRASFTIAQATGPITSFFLSPDSLTFTGPDTLTCASNGSADVHIFGGTPPYTVTNPGPPLAVFPNVVQAGGSFIVATSGFCISEPGLPITVVDAAGRTAVVRVANLPGTAEIPILQAQPPLVELTDCDSTTGVIVIGGTGQYVASSSDPSVIALPIGNRVTIRRSGAPTAPAEAAVVITSGHQSVTVTVKIALDPQTCP